jgi:hypothetical protein
MRALEASAALECRSACKYDSQARRIPYFAASIHFSRCEKLNTLTLGKAGLNVGADA